jgi:hypothetical protein
MGKKLLVSLAMEGKFASHGLQSLDEDDDMLTAMARELVTQKGVGEKADELWRQIQKQQMHVIESGRPTVVESPLASSQQPQTLLTERPPSQETPHPPSPLVGVAEESSQGGRKPRFDGSAQLSLAF